MSILLKNQHRNKQCFSSIVCCFGALWYWELLFLLMFGMDFLDKNNQIVIALSGVINNNNQYKVLFGKPVKITNYKSSELIAIPFYNLIIYQVWAGNKYGTTIWDIYVFTGTCDSKLLQSIPNIYPPVELWLYAKGKTRAKKFLKLIRNIQATEANLNLIPKNYWVRQNARLWTRMQLILPENEKNFV